VTQISVDSDQWPTVGARAPVSRFAEPAVDVVGERKGEEAPARGVAVLDYTQRTASLGDLPLGLARSNAGLKESNHLLRSACSRELDFFPRCLL